MRTLVKHHWLLVFSLVLCQLSVSPVFAQSTPPNVNVEQELVDDPGYAGCQTMPNGQRQCEGFGSKLTAHDSILVTQSVHTVRPPAPTNHNEDFPGDASNSVDVCYSISNRSDKSYYVPWNTPLEWRKFLIAVGAPDSLSLQLGLPAPNISPQGFVHDIVTSSCCAPEEVGTICQGVGGDIVSHAQLGYRWNDKLSGHYPNWGAQSDVYGPVYAASVNGDDNINFQVTFVCSNGAWIKTHALGSCVPLDGQCSTGSSSLTQLPADTTTLCSTGSILSNLQGPPGGPWTWTCMGTPGRASASCSTGPTNGECGTQAGWPYAGWGGEDGPYSFGSEPWQNLCTNGTTASHMRGPDFNTVPGVYVPNLYHWKCNGTGVGSTNAQCSAPDATGICAVGVSDGAWSATAPDPATRMLCYVGTPTTITYGPSIWGGAYATTLAWNWVCTGLFNTPAYNDNCSTFDTNQPMPGTCGDADGQLFNSPTVPPSDLCGSSSSVTSGPTYIANPPHWTWVCRGNNNGSTQNCDANVDPNPGQCGPADDNPSATMPTSGLCSTGTFIQGNNSPTQWRWRCQSALGNDDWCSAPVAFTAQCGPANGVASSTQPDSDNTCMYGSNDFGVDSDANTWSWQCVGWNNGSSIVNCSAPRTAATVENPTCGSANGVTSTTQPTSGLCGVGFATNKTSGGGMWIWDCMSGTNVVNCAAPSGGSGAGICGLTHNTSIPNRPNVNLCMSGQESVVQGNGPWTWQCLGQGPNSGQNANCQAEICGACTGSISISGSAARSGTHAPSGCAVTGTSTWTEIDAITTSSNSRTIRWTDDLNNPFSKTVTAQAAAGYCPPCFQSPQSVSNVQTSVHGASGSCPGNGNVNSGNPFSLPASNVLVQ